ncbi:RluA family pseudouridine synthase [Sulfurospirillum sp. T05]|uniref:RNA pseudouridylate synthase n=1 Tax=Sulfurospirillum tamanense TaxID=2813362 RepID=A0ABS2WT68_9BACT|nr:RluA family pseudouridine synthase [Sulfurospirillum tamanensis]MBN2964857.1 RluA family pseudouridine synthase [Sulfurospirillum tamanensis]
MKEEKAYKLLAMQEKISNRAAKDLIDQGLVYAKGKKVLVARGNLDVDVEFRVEKPAKPTVIFENDKVLVLDKPAFVLSEELATTYGHPLLHRLDKETSGVLILVKDEEYQKAAIEEFKALRVEKIYFAAVGGKCIEPATIEAPILTVKGKGGAVSKISANGKPALTRMEPYLVEGKHSLVKVSIQTGRTHQIRVHLRSIGFSILGDEKYGGKQADRMMLHAYSVTLFGQTFKSPLPSAFKKYGFSGV